METAATINARLPRQLKENGSKVLERNGVSPTELVRSMYRYMEREQELPSCLDISPENAQGVYQRRRELLRSFDGFMVDDYGTESKDARAQRIEKKYGDLL